MAGCWWTGETGQMERHALLGYLVLALLLFRIVWGLVGSETARFASFVRGPRAAAAHLRHLFGRGPIERPVGHNAAGGYAVLALLVLLLAQAVSGLFLYDEEIYWAPLNAWVSEETAQFLNWLHDKLFDVLLVLIAVHVAAILLYLFARRLDLVSPMLSGRAELPEGAASPRTAPMVLAFALFGLAVLAVALLVNFAE